MKILNEYKACKISGDYYIEREVALLEQDDVYFTSSSERTTGCGTSKIRHYCSVDYFDIHQAKARFIQEIKQCKDNGYDTEEMY